MAEQNNLMRKAREVETEIDQLYTRAEIIKSGDYRLPLLRHQLEGQLLKRSDPSYYGPPDEKEISRLQSRIGEIESIVGTARTGALRILARQTEVINTQG